VGALRDGPCSTGGGKPLPGERIYNFTAAYQTQFRRDFSAVDTLNNMNKARRGSRLGENCSMSRSGMEMGREGLGGEGDGHGGKPGRCRLGMVKGSPGRRRARRGDRPEGLSVCGIPLDITTGVR